MSNAITDTPFKIVHYNFSWESYTRTFIDNLVRRFSDNYKLAYFNDFHQKVILLINNEPQLFEQATPQVLVISKIDNSDDSSMLAFEIRCHSANSVSKDSYSKGWDALQKIAVYLKRSEN